MYKQQSKISHFRMLSTRRAQSALSICEEHPDEELDYFCWTCNLRVCEECCRDEHLSHEWKRAKKVVRQIRRNVGGRCRELDDMIRNLKERDEAASQADRERIENVRIKFVALINDFADKLKAKRKGKKSRANVSKEIEDLENLLNFYRNEIQTAEDSVTLDVEEEFHRLRKDIASLPEDDTEEKNLRFKEGTISPEVVHYMFGDVMESVPKVNVTEKSDFTLFDDSEFIRNIFLLTAEEAFIRRNNSDKLHHVYRTEKNVSEKKLPTSFSSLCILGDGDIVYTVFGRNIIRHLSTSGTVNTICSTTPLHPSEICQSRTGGLLVCLSDGDTPDITVHSQGEVHHVDLLGNTLKEYKMFTLPKRLAQNLNLDICVVDYTDTKSNSRLLVITATGKVRFIYNGQSSMQKKFTARDVCCDNRGRILVVDLHNNAVHLLREDGEFLQYVLTELNEIRGPRCLALYDDTLWVGCRKGLVKVYRYYEDNN